MVDMMKKKKKKNLRNKFNPSSYDFCSALPYSKMNFGIEDDIVDIYEPVYLANLK